MCFTEFFSSNLICKNLSANSSSFQAKPSFLQRFFEQATLIVVFTCNAFRSVFSSNLICRGYIYSFITLLDFTVQGVLLPRKNHADLFAAFDSDCPVRMSLQFVGVDSIVLYGDVLGAVFSFLDDKELNELSKNQCQVGTENQNTMNLK